MKQIGVDAKKPSQLKPATASLLLNAETRRA
jgi:hypothetical protein